MKTIFNARNYINILKNFNFIAHKNDVFIFILGTGEDFNSFVNSSRHFLNCYLEILVL